MKIHLNCKQILGRTEVINTTFTTNENFGEYDEDLESRDRSPIAPNAILFRNGVDVDINNLVSFGFNRRAIAQLGLIPRTLASK